MKPLSLRIDRIMTPIGELALVADGNGVVRAIDWTDHSDRLNLLLERYYAPYNLDTSHNTARLRDALLRYFDGDLEAIDMLPVAMPGTSFQRAVWGELRRVPCGTWISYSELARRIGRPAAIRAVGLANGANPIGIVVPCHRIIGRNGNLTGYGGGLDRKRWLLRHEKALRDTNQLGFAI